MNKKVYKEGFENYYNNNLIHLYMHKSSRKNAKMSDCIMAYHLINKNENEMLSDDRILSQFVSTIESVVHQSKQFNNHLEITVYAMVGKQVKFINANNNLYHDIDKRRYTFKRVKFSSVEGCINFIYDMYCLIYPYNTISLRNTVYNNPSIKYHINRYYSKEVSTC